MARYDKAEQDERFSSRESAAEILGMDRTRLSKIELGTVLPYAEEVVTMAEAYDTPELKNRYCSGLCPIGIGSVTELNIEEFDRLALKVLGSLKNTEKIRSMLISIAEDGRVNEPEYSDFCTVLDELGKIADSASALKLWATKYVEDVTK